MAKLTKGLIVLLLLLSACSGLEQSEQENLRRFNAKGEFIYRNHNEYLYAIAPPEQRVRERYSWESSYIGKLPKITKEFFRCRGSELNPVHYDVQNVDNKDPIRDCGGIQKHSLPLRHDKEFIYPVLIDLLNYVQAKTGKKVVITCGHRCPAHNTYADPSNANRSSKHMIGAEVDFYVQGMEQQPEEIVKILVNFYRETEGFRGKKEYEEFLRYDKLDTNSSIMPWYNKEILIKLLKKQEGRDFDNRHPYPYICIQVRQDRETGERINYSWPKAFNGYMRY